MMECSSYNELNSEGLLKNDEIYCVDDIRFKCFHICMFGLQYKDIKGIWSCNNNKNLSSALKMFKSDTGFYPTQEQGLYALIECPNNISGWFGPYVSRIDIDPWGQKYVYKIPSNIDGLDFLIYSAGEDGISKSEGNDPDDINNSNGISINYYGPNFGLIAIKVLSLGAVLICFISLFSKLLRSIRLIKEMRVLQMFVNDMEKVLISLIVCMVLYAIFIGPKFWL